MSALDTHNYTSRYCRSLRHVLRDIEAAAREGTAMNDSDTTKQQALSHADACGERPAFSSPM